MAHPGLRQALQYVNDTLTYRYPAHSTDQIPCWATNTLIVFRVPGNKTFDRELRTVASRRQVIVNVIDTKYSRRSMFATGDEVLIRRSALANCGAVWNDHGPSPAGYLLVGVRSHLPCARKVLADLGDRVRIVIHKVRGFPS